MNFTATGIHHGLATKPPESKVCGQCPAFTARQVGPLTIGHVTTTCAVTGVHVCSRCVQCHLTDEQKATWATVKSTSSR
jgi:hypothetical protein